MSAETPEQLERADGLLRSALGKLDPAVLCGPDEVEFAILAIREARALFAAALSDCLERERQLREGAWLWVVTKDGRSGALRLIRYDDDTDAPEAFIEWENQAGAADWVPMEDEDGNLLITPALLATQPLSEPRPERTP